MFSHGGVINAPAAHHPEHARRLLCVHVDYAGVTRLLSSRDGNLGVASINGTEHVWDLLPEKPAVVDKSGDSSLDGLDLGALDRTCARSASRAPVNCARELISGGRSNLTFLVFDDASKWVLRRPPLHGLTPSAHDMAREYKVVAALAGHTGARRPRRHDAQRRLGARRAIPDGRVRAGPRRPAHRRTRGAGRPGHHQACVDALIKVLADLHAVDPEAVGLGDFGKPTGYLERQVRALGLAVGTGQARERPVRRRRAGDCTPALAEAIPTQSRTSIVHGDYRIDNTMLDADDATKVRAVLDWEMSTLGDPLSDAALMCVYRHPMFNMMHAEPAWASPLMPSADELAQRYSLAAEQPLDTLGLLHGAGVLQGGDHRGGHRVPRPGWVVASRPTRTKSIRRSAR